MERNIIKRKVSEDEIKNFTEMLNWAIDNDANNSMSISVSKMYDSNDRHYETMYTIKMFDWIDGKHVHKIGKGKTLTEAMKNLFGVK